MDRLQRALDWIIPLLKQHAHAFHISGGFGAHLYGATRPINDIDVDLPSSSLEKVMPHVSQYVEYGPIRHKDATWDIYLVMLNFHGQLIDLTSDDDPRISNKVTAGWDPLKMTFADIRIVEKFGHKLPVQNPSDMIVYKRKISWDEEKHLSDVEAINRYLAGQKS
jgi:hypothetical protein